MWIGEWEANVKLWGTVEVRVSPVSFPSAAASVYLWAWNLNSKTSFAWLSSLAHHTLVARKNVKTWPVCVCNVCNVCVSVLRQFEQQQPFSWTGKKIAPNKCCDCIFAFSLFANGIFHFWSESEIVSLVFVFKNTANISLCSAHRTWN